MNNLISMTLAKEIANFFEGMTVVEAVMFMIGLILIITEFFRPMRGLGYISGSVVAICAVVLRMLSNATVGTLFLMLLFAAFVLLAAHLLMLALHKREWLLMSTGTAEDEFDGGGEYSFLVGLKGVTTTAVAPNGHMSINDINFYVTSDKPIAAGTEVTVKQVSGAKIIVEEAESGRQTEER